jgi:hypothetical protein
MTLSFHEQHFEIADVRREWTRDPDGVPCCTVCRQALRFIFGAPNSPIAVRCDHFTSHLVPRY